MAVGGKPELELWETATSRSVTAITDGAGQSSGGSRLGKGGCCNNTSLLNPEVDGVEVATGQVSVAYYSRPALRDLCMLRVRSVPEGCTLNTNYVHAPCTLFPCSVYTKGRHNAHSRNAQCMLWHWLHVPSINDL